MRKALLIAAVVLMVLPALGAQGASDKEEAAGASVREWLGMVDDGKYGQSWSEASSMFRNAITRERWEETLRAVRAPLGKVRSRKAVSASYTTSLPGAPDGEYVVLQFAASYENKKEAVETVTATLDKDRRWRIAGYYIK